MGPDTHERIVRSACPAMATYGLRLAGLSDAGEGYQMQRIAWRESHILVCFGGRGRVWTPDVGFRECGPGQAYLSPSRQPLAFETLPGQRWRFAWLFYDTGPGMADPVPTATSTLVDVDDWPFITAVQGLYRESISHAQPSVMDRWVDLLQTAVSRITEPVNALSLHALWEQVDAKLAHPWKLSELAGAAGMSREKLRTICLQQTGRSPMAQVTHLRMHRAAAMLSSTNHTVQSIGEAVGYPNAPAFCTAFKHMFGRPPNAYREMHDRITLNTDLTQPPVVNAE